jgi:hypothetical protein
MSLGWLQPIDIVKNGKFTMRDSETTNDIYSIRNNFPSSDEFLLIENRQPKLFDSLLWNGGIMVWHIDNSVNGMQSRGYPGQEGMSDLSSSPQNFNVQLKFSFIGWPGNNKHYQIALLAPDGRYSLETGENKGDSGDFWQPGMQLSPGPTNSVSAVTILTNNGDYPNTNSYLSGIIKSTGFRLFNFSVNGDNMTFQVEGMKDDELIYTPQPTTSIPTFSPSYWSVDPSLNPTHLSSFSPSNMPQHVFSSPPSSFSVRFIQYLY